MAAVSLFVIVQAVADTAGYVAAPGPLSPRRSTPPAALDRAVVFLPPLDGPWLLQPFSLARNATFDGPVVWALDRGDRRNLDVVRHLPGRTPYRVVSGATERLRRPPCNAWRSIDGRLVPAG